MTQREKYGTVTLEEILSARDARAARQRDLLSRFQAPLISFTMNVPGPQKNSPAIYRAFLYGLNEIKEKLPAKSLLTSLEINEKTGCEAYLSVRMPKEELKSLCVAVEESEPIGRLFDLDVLGEDGEKISRDKERGCFVCGAHGRACAARRLHSVEELQKAVTERITEHFKKIDPKKIARLATDSLKDEVRTTPKPGLVDERNTGSHKDMSLPLFLASADALENYFADAVAIGIQTKENPPEAAFSRLRERGVFAEKEMLSVTGGVNTHKGAVFSLGVLCGAAGRLWSAEAPAADTQKILTECKKLTESAVKRDFASGETDTAGKRLYHSLGITGIRGEASRGFPSLSETALPLLEKLTAGGESLRTAGAVTLLHLIARVEDTNLYRRGGVEGAKFAKSKAAQLLLLSPLPEKGDIERLDDAFIEKNLSPGGSADLLAAAYFLYKLKSLT